MARYKLWQLDTFNGKTSVKIVEARSQREAKRKADKKLSVYKITRI